MSVTPGADIELGQQDSRPTLVFDHNVIEHLGIKLYQNKPANVLAELLSNSWDADAERVWINVVEAAQTTPALISVGDDGLGMTLAEIKARYFGSRTGKALKTDGSI